MLLHILLAVVLILGSTLAGTLGLMHFEQLHWQDALLNCSMMLSGMGILHTPQSGLGKLFIGGFALYAGLLFVATASLILAPVIHRLLHTFHWKAD